MQRAAGLRALGQRLNRALRAVSALRVRLNRALRALGVRLNRALRALLELRAAGRRFSFGKATSV
jgi:hypothetical protein